MTHVPLAELPQYAANILAALWMQGKTDRATIITLRGDLGAGKTTFVQALARRLGITEVLQSPTYVLMKTYPLAGERTSFGAPRRFNRLIHIDAYRLERPEEFKTLEPDAFLNDPRALVLVEWPERLGPLLPKPDMEIVFSAKDADAGGRYIEVV